MKSVIIRPRTDEGSLPEPRTRPPLGAAALCLAAAAETFWLTRSSGVWITPDGAAYLSVADNLTSGRGLTLFDGSHLSLWPPGFPVLIAGVRWATGLPVESAARFVNVALGVIIVALTWLLARRHLGERWAMVVIAVLLLPATGLTWITVEAWSEPLATALLLGSILMLEQSREKDEIRWGCLAAAGLLAAGAGLTRYSAAFVVAGGGLALALTGPGWSRRRRLTAAGAFTAVASVPTLLWLAHVWRVTGYPAGARVADGTAPGEVMRQLATTVGSLVLPGLTGPGPTLWVGRAALALCVALTLAVAHRTLRSIRSKPSAQRHQLRSALPITCVIGVYVVGTLSAAVAVRFDPIGPRLLAPVLPGGLVLIALALRAVAPSRLPRSALAVAGVAVLVWAGYAVRSTIRSPRLGQVVSYGAPVWRIPVEAALDRVSQVAPAAHLWSDAPDAIWVAQHRSARSTPERVRSFVSRSPVQQVEAFRDAVARSDEDFIVWIDDRWVSYLYSPEQLAKVVPLRLVGSGNQWSVYQVVADH